MNFVDTSMLWGATAVAVPILLHFFFRSRYRTVPWAAMKFLLLSIEQTSRRLKFQELLLLIVRCALLALLAFALARPLFSSSAGASGREAVDAVFVFDTSFSMGAREGKQARLDHAKSAALAVMEHLPPYSTVQVVTCADKADLLGPRAPEQLDVARALMKKIELTDLATDLAPGVTEAFTALDRGTSPKKELYIFSDMQKLGWDANAAALTKALKDVRAKARVYMVRCGEQTLRNVAVVGIAPQSGIPRPGERVGFAVLVRNTGTVPVQNLRVALAVDGKDRECEEQAVAKLDPGETRALTLTAKLEKAGLRVLTATVKQDDLEADNRFDQVIQVRDQLRVLVIDGGADLKEPRLSSSYYLMHALLPVKHVRATELTPRQASATELSRSDVCILVNTALERDPRRIAETLPADFIENLRGFVSKGGGLIIFGGDNVAAEPYNRILGKRLGLLPLTIRGTASYPLDKPIAFDRKSIESASFLRFKEDEDYKGLASVGIWRTLDVEEAPRKAGKEAAKEPKADPTRVLMRYSNGKPALVSRKVDSGEVLLVGTSADLGLKPGTNVPTWNILPLWTGYIPFVETSLNHLLHRQTQTHNFTAGETLHWHPEPRDAGRSFVLEYPPEDAKTPGKRVPLGKPDSVQGRPVVTATDLHRAGVYQLKAADRGEGGEAAPEGEGAARQKKFQPLPFAVVPDLRESANLETLSDQQIDERLGFRPVHLKSGGNVNVTAETERTNQEWTLWLLAAVLLLAVCESVLAWFCGRAW